MADREGSLGFDAVDESLYVCTLCHGYGDADWVYTPCSRNYLANAPGQNAGHECDPLPDVIAAAYGSDKHRSSEEAPNG